jgi:hypothetical protein
VPGGSVRALVREGSIATLRHERGDYEMAKKAKGGKKKAAKKR